MKEYLDLVDLENRILGQELRSRVRAENLLHRGVGILCWNSKNQLYVHQRTATKDVFPSMYDMMVGGAVEAGEDYAVAAAREVSEELGIRSTPSFILEHLYQGPQNRSFVQLFEVVWDGPIVWQESEICWGDWMDFERVLDWIEKVPVVPDGLEVFQQFLRFQQKKRG